MHDGMHYDPIQGQGQASPSKLEIWPFSRAIFSTIYTGWIFDLQLFFVSRDFEAVRKVSFENSTVSLVWN